MNRSERREEKAEMWKEGMRREQNEREVKRREEKEETK